MTDGERDGVIPVIVEDKDTGGVVQVDANSSAAGEFLPVVVADTGEETLSTVPGSESISIVVADTGEKKDGEKIIGKNFIIDGSMAIIFGEKGKKGSGGQWDRPFGTQWRGATPEPQSPKVLAAIQEDITNNDFDRISRVLISHDVALFLFLEGVLSVEHFQVADESQVNTNPIFGEEGETFDPAITLSSVTFGEHTFPVTILDCIGSGKVATLDENWKKI